MRYNLLWPNVGQARTDTLTHSYPTPQKAPSGTNSSARTQKTRSDIWLHLVALVRPHQFQKTMYNFLPCEWIRQHATHGDAHNSLGFAAEDFCFLKGSVPLRNTIILPSRTHFPNADGKVAQFFFFFSGEPWKASCVGLFDVWFGLLFSSKPWCCHHLPAERSGIDKYINKLTYNQPRGVWLLLWLSDSLGSV